MMLAKFQIPILDLNITPELKNEGIARDVVRAVQQARKDANLNIADRILLTIDAPEKLKGAIIANQNYISEQTLSEMKKIEKHVHKADAEIEGVMVKVLLG